MFSPPMTPTSSERIPAPSAPARNSVAANALRSAGLIERGGDARMKEVRSRDGPSKDARMKDGSKDKKTTIRSHRSRVIDNIKDRPAGLKAPQLLASRASGASQSGPSRLTGLLGRTRRNAVSAGNKTAPLLTDAAVRPGTSHQIDHWREFVHSRWNAPAGYLNLDSMTDDPILKKYNMSIPGSDGASPREAAVIFKLTSQLTPEVKTISLANNNLRSAAFLSTLSHYLPRLQNLSLQNNKLRQWKDVDYISTRKGKLANLRELILLGNPVRELEFSNGRGDNYKTEIARRFPMLEILDQEPVPRIAFDVPTASSSSFNVPTATTFPIGMCGSLIPSEVGSWVEAFLTKFFTAYDSSRESLLPAYTQSSTFSFSANTAIPQRGRVQGFQQSLPNQKKLEWGSWLNAGSRNLSRLGSLDKSVETLHISAPEIVKCFLALPKTTHDLTDNAKFVVDAWPVPGVATSQADSTVLFVTIHGQFTEAPSMGIRSFDRSFVLAPAGNGSPAQQAGWGVVVLSDQLVVRGYSSHEAWAPGPLKTQSETPAAQVNQEQQRQQKPEQSQLQSNDPGFQSIPEPQRTLALQLSIRTRLNAEFSVLCLEGNEWNLDRAFANFEALKPTIPPHAFL